MPTPQISTVTFLFTDIEDSTPLWEQHPQAMRAAVARHDQILRQTIEDSGGRIFKTIGDQFCAAFEKSEDAANAAVACQQALTNEAWPEGCLLRVRMAVHIGEVEARDADYFGPALNRISRLLAAGHGGQILVSQAAADEMRGRLPEDVSLLHRGCHRLRGVAEPETIYQVLHPALSADFGALQSLRAFAHNLPEPLTSFVGRKKELQQVKDLLSRHRMVSLLGPGGVGKTRLAIQAASAFLDSYPDGVWLVDLAPLAPGSPVEGSAAAALGVREEVGRPLAETLQNYLEARKLLLILDNCEHVIESCARLTSGLLRNCPHLQILATSQQAPGTPGAAQYRVPPLPLPDERPPIAPDGSEGSDAIALFRDRAVAAMPAFRLSPANYGAVIQICRQLDGIPLALELAAAWTDVLTPRQIAARLGDHIKLLTRGIEGTGARHETLYEMMELSYGLLSAPERALFGELSVFAGGWSLAAAEAVCSAPGSNHSQVLQCLSRLVDKSLVTVEERLEEKRYRFLETLRQFGAGKLEEAGGTAEFRRRHAAFFLNLGEEAEPALIGPGQENWLTRLELEHDNLRAALSWLNGEGNAPAEAQQLAGALARFWHIRGHFTEGRERINLALERAEHLGPSAARARALNAAGFLAQSQGDYAIAKRLCEQGLAIRQNLGDRRGIAASLSNLGVIAESVGDSALAQNHYEESLSIRREMGDRWGAAVSLNNLALLVADQEDLETARRLQEESLAIRRELNDSQGIATSLNNLGLIAARTGDFNLARTLWTGSLSMFRGLGDPRCVANTLNNLGYIALGQGDHDGAEAFHDASLDVLQELGDRRGLTAALERLAAVAHSQGRFSRAARLWGAAESSRRALGTPLAPDDQDEYNRLAATARAEMGEDAFRSAWIQGAALSLTEAVEYARGGRDD